MGVPFSLPTNEVGAYPDFKPVLVFFGLIDLFHRLLKVQQIYYIIVLYISIENNNSKWSRVTSSSTGLH